MHASTINTKRKLNKYIVSNGVLDGKMENYWLNKESDNNVVSAAVLIVCASVCAGSDGRKRANYQ